MSKELTTAALWRSLLNMNRQLKLTLQLMNASTSVTNSAIALLFQLEFEPSMKMNDIADYLSITMGAATSLVDKLVHQGWVQRERSSEDRRMIYVQLTDIGRQKMVDMRDYYVLQAKSIFDPIPEEELAGIAAGLTRMEQYLCEYNQLIEKTKEAPPFTP